MKKIFFVCMLILLFISPVSAEITNVTCTATETSLLFEFNPDLSSNDEVFYNNELVLYPITEKVFLPGLESDTYYSIVIHDKSTDEIQIATCKTGDIDCEEFYLQYGLIGIFIIILLTMLIAYYIPYIGYVSFILSFFGFVEVLSRDCEFLIALIFVVLMVSSLILSTWREK